MNNPIGLIIATKIEAEPFIKGLGLDTIEKTPVPVMGNGAIVLAVSEIGKTNAAIATAHLIEKLGPSRIFNLGAAGGVKRGLQIGDILHVDKIYELDRPRLPSGDPVVHMPDTLTGFRTVTLATQDRPVVTEPDRIAAGKIADLVDMEGAAVVQVCQAFEVSVNIFKIVTDTDECSPKEILVNILKTRNSLFEFFRDRVLPKI
jgi:adenosylhomocysteine nucleosidase